MIAVILAGGEGTRLRPYTISLPKPLMPVGKRPILEIMVRQLKQAGIKKLIFAVGYLESLIQAYFGDGRKYGVEIMYSSEKEPLGTAGPMILVKSELNDTFFLMNGDLLTDINFMSMMDFHKKEKAVATVGIAKRNVEIDFGVVNITDKKQYICWQEKPNIEYFVSMGIYLFEPSVLKFLPSGHIHMPDFINKLNGQNQKISIYLHSGYWLDIGRHEDYEKACRDYNNSNEISRLCE